MEIPDYTAVKSNLESWTEEWNRPSEEASHQGWIEFLDGWRAEGTDEWFARRSDQFFELVSGEIELDLDSSLMSTLRRLHLCNNVIWYFEDEVRRKDISPEKTVDIKRGIDAVNQKRNDQMEVLDEAVFRDIQPDDVDESVPMHTEPPGLIMDRLSIMTLKIFHYGNQSRQEEVRALRQQRDDLGTAFDRLLSELQRGEKQIKIYRQYKSYNDPETNPVLEE